MRYKILYYSSMWGFRCSGDEIKYFQLDKTENNYSLTQIRFFLKRHRQLWAEGKTNTKIVHIWNTQY